MLITPISILNVGWEWGDIIQCLHVNNYIRWSNMSKHRGDVTRCITLHIRWGYVSSTVFGKPDDGKHTSMRMWNVRF